MVLCAVVSVGALVYENKNTFNKRINHRQRSGVINRPAKSRDPVPFESNTTLVVVWLSTKRTARD